MENKITKLQKLKERMGELKPIVSKSFNTSNELQNYKKENKKLFLEYYELFEEIEKLEWDLMTPEEKERQKKYKKFLRLKAKGEPFDLDEFI